MSRFKIISLSILLIEIIILILGGYMIVQDYRFQNEHIVTNRFQIIEQQDSGFLENTTYVVYDTQTRVKYYIIESRSGIAITPLLDSKGNVTLQK